MFPWDSETGSALTSSPKGLELFSAAGTPASKVNVVVLDLEAVAADIGPREFVQARVLQVEDVPAVQADEVMVLVQLGVEPRERAGVAGLGQEAEGDECPQDAMDRHPRDLGQVALRLPGKPAPPWVVTTVQDGFKHSPALIGDRQPTLTMGGEEPVDPLLLFRRIHVSGMD